MGENMLPQRREVANQRLSQSSQDRIWAPWEWGSLANKWGYTKIKPGKTASYCLVCRFCFRFSCIRKVESGPKFKGPQDPVFSHRSLYDRVLSGRHSKVLDAREFLGQFWEGRSGTA